MKTYALLALIALEAATVTANKVVPLSFSKTKRNVAPEARLQRRASPVSATLDNADVLYLINVTVGTPPQKLSLQVDTGSSDVWMPASNVNCQKTQDGCAGGTFNQHRSSTFKVVDRGGFNISYVDNTGSSGDYFTDNYSFGGITVKNLQMGLALETTIGSGIMGIAYADGEAVCNGQFPSECNEYPSVVQDLVTQGYIQSEAYSLWLDDLDASTGQLLFGGVDTAKYKGDLVALPIQPDSQSFTINSFTVSWVNLTLNANGKTVKLVEPGFASPAIFDSGTSITVLPDNIAKEALSQLGAEYSQEYGGYVGNCAVGKAKATFDFTFGASDGAKISVPVSELFDPATDENGEPLYFNNGGQVCQVGIAPAQGDPVLFGDTFLRSAYVVYDLANNQIGLANTNFNPSGSNVVAIGKDGIPGISKTASAVRVDQTGTDSFGPTGSSYITNTMSVPFTATGSAILGGFFTATGNADMSNIAGSHTHGTSGSAAILMTGIGVMMAAFGGSLVFL